VKLRPSTIRWIIRSGGIPHQTHTSSDYPRELEAKGLITRRGPGMLGHLHVLEGTEAGRAYDLELMDAELAKLPQEVRDALLHYVTTPAECLHAYPDIVWQDRGRWKLTSWGLHLVWRQHQRARDAARGDDRR
jgi:hypothetical protein